MSLPNAAQSMVRWVLGFFLGSPRTLAELRDANKLRGAIVGNINEAMRSTDSWLR